MTVDGSRERANKRESIYLQYDARMRFHTGCAPLLQSDGGRLELGVVACIVVLVLDSGLTHQHTLNAVSCLGTER